MKRHIIIVTACIVGTLGIVGAGVLANARLDPTSAYVALKKESFKEDAAEKEKDKRTAYSGKHVDITLEELKESERFYLAKGESETDARKDALYCQEEYNALVAKAKENGYSVTEQDVDDYLAQLKEMFKEAENKDELEAIISAYPSEDAYWDYMKKVYRKHLIAQNYVADLEKSFAKDYFGEQGSDEYNKAWRQWFDSFKKKAIAEEGFEAVKGVPWLK